MGCGLTTFSSMRPDISTTPGRLAGHAWLLWLLWALLGAGHARAEGAPLHTVREATLTSAAGERKVELPHVLQTSDFAPEGSRVRYRLQFDLPAIEDQAPGGEPLGIYVPKMSLAGRLALNGEQVGACELGPLETLRCLHRPYLFVPPMSHWRATGNVLEFEIHATSRQMNGLSAVTVGPAKALSRGGYGTRRAVQVGVVNGLAWVALSLGLIVLCVSVALGGDRLYGWFGLTAFAIALGNLNYIVSVPPVRPEVFSWFVFSINQVTAPLLMLTLLSFFRREWPWMRRGLVAFMVAGPAAVWFSGSNRDVVALLYVPFMLLGPALAATALFWSWRSRRTADWCMALSFAAVVASSFLDWFRLTGKSAFEGVYLVTYVIPSTAVVMGATLAGQLAAALRIARELTATLDRRVAERTEDLVRANRQLEELSATDGLTGLTNRRHFDETLAKEWLRARRHGHPLALLMIDVDHFKRFNDTHGHLAGDECLRRVAQVLRARMLRGSDTTARYGGEEFAVITGADAQGARLVAERLRQDVESLVLPYAPEKAGMVTVSIGVAALVPDESRTPTGLIALADDALYQAKQNGRNRVAVAAPPLP